MIAALLAAAVGFAVGYIARILRPVRRVDTWAWDQVYRRSRDLREGLPRKRPGWYGAQLVFAVEVAGLFAVRPRQMIRQWRHRNDPPPPRGPAPTFDPEWAAKRRVACGPECSEQHTYAYRCVLKSPPMDPRTILGVDADDSTSPQEGAAP